jgi:hypothetical protein
MYDHSYIVFTLRMKYDRDVKASKLSKQDYIAKLRTIGEQNKEKILEDIARSGGRSTGQLKEDTGLSRETIYTLCRQLEQAGLISKKGKFAKYRLTNKALEDPALSSWIFSREAMKSFSRWTVMASRPNKFSTINEENHAAEYLAQRELFEFGNKIGALITYILLQAIRPRILRINGTKTSGTAKKVQLSGKEKTEQAKLWVEKTINPFRILFEFCRVPTIAKGLAVWAGDIPIDKSLPAEVQKKARDIQKKRRKINPQDPLWTQFEMDEESFSKLTAAFAIIYPEINAQLELIRRTLPDKIEEHKEWDRKHLEAQ